MQTAPRSRDRRSLAVPAAGRAWVVSLLIAVVCIAAHLCGVAHMVLARHVACAEHGELLEVGSPGAPAAGAALPGAGPEIAATAPGEAAGHEHCAVAAHLRRALGYRAPAAAAAVIAAAPVAPPLPAAWPAQAVAEVRPIALFLLAPKTSPPV